MRIRLAAVLCLWPGLVAAGPCALAYGEGGVWDHVGTITQVRPMTVLLVTRHVSEQPLGGNPVTSTLWIDDVPSDTLEAGAICDAVQLETPLPFNTWERQPISMQQGERLRPGADLPAALAGRIAAENRRVEIRAKAYFVSHVADLDAPDWREELLTAAAKAGEIDTQGWIVGLPGALYLIPMVRP